MTKKYCRLATLFTVLSLALNFGPLLGYMIAAFVNSELVVEKVALCSTIMIVLILTLVGVARKITFRSTLWILLIGVYVALKNIMTPLLIISVCQILDELIASPLAKRYRNKKMIHREMDKRL